MTTLACGQNTPLEASRLTVTVAGVVPGTQAYRWGLKWTAGRK